MQIIGYWAHTIEKDDLIYPHELKICSDPVLRKKILAYLKKGSEFAQYMGYSYCRFTCGVEWSKMGSGEATDGFWIWPDGLAHYVEQHQIMLPDEFIASVLGEQPEIKIADPEDNLSFWRAWCESRRTDQTRKLLKDIQARCDQKIDQVCERIYFNQTNSVGESDQNCSWQECEKQALNGKMFCARHLDTDKSFGRTSFETISIRHVYTHLFLDLLTQPPLESKRINFLGKLYKAITSHQLAVPFHTQQYEMKLNNERIVAAGAARAKAFHIENGRRSRPNWIEKKRGVLFLTDQKLVCGDWKVDLADIRAAMLFRTKRFFSTFLILQVETIVDVDYLFELLYDPAWEEQKALELLIFNRLVEPEWKKTDFLRVFKIISWTILIGIFFFF